MTTTDDAKVAGEESEIEGGWYVLEIMGHRRVAGLCREVRIAGVTQVRVDIPSDPPLTQYYGGGAFFCITPTTEDVARRLMEKADPFPVSRYELLPAPSRQVVDHDEIDDSDMPY